MRADDQALATRELRVQMRVFGDLSEPRHEADQIVTDAAALVRMRPSEGSISPTSIFAVVLFPAPFGPRHPKISAGRIWKLWRHGCYLQVAG